MYAQGVSLGPARVTARCMSCMNSQHTACGRLGPVQCAWLQSPLHLARHHSKSFPRRAEVLQGGGLRPLIRQRTMAAAGARRCCRDRANPHRLRSCVAQHTAQPYTLPLPMVLLASGSRRDRRTAGVGTCSRRTAVASRLHAVVHVALQLTPLPGADP